jgi:hypothetical protein
MGLLAKASVAIDGSKFKAVNSRDNNFTQGTAVQGPWVVGFDECRGRARRPRRP